MQKCKRHNILKVTSCFIFVLVAFSGCFDNVADKALDVKKNESINITKLLEKSTSIQSENPQLSLEFSIKALNLAEKTNNSQLITKCYNNVGLGYSELSKFDEAYKYFSKAIEVSKQIGDSLQLASGYKNVATVYSSMGAHYSASQNVDYALEIYNKSNNQRGKALCYVQKANINLRVKNFDDAEHFLSEAVKIRESLNDSIGIEVCNILLGENYLGKNDYNQALIHFKKAKEFFTTHPENRFIVLCYCGEGEVYIAQKEFGKALDIIHLADKIASSRNKKNQIARTQHLLGEAYTMTFQYNKANESLLKALKLCDEINLYDRKLLVLELYSELKFKEGKYALAYKSLKSMNMLKDSITSDEKNKMILELELINDNRKKEEKIKLQELQLGQTQVDVLRRNTIILLLIFLLIISAILVGFFFKQHKLSEKHSLILEETNEQIEHQKNELKKLNATKDRFISIIAHDLKSPFNSLLGFSMLLTEKLSSPPLDNAKILNLSKSIKNGVEQTYLMLQNLLEWSLASNGRIKVTTENINLNSAVYKVYSEVITQANEKEIQIEITVDPEIEVLADLHMLKIIIRNLLSNAIKYSQKLKTVKLFVDVEGDWVYVSIEDNGVGISNELLDKLFKIEVKTSTKGTFGETGTGLGLILCKEFIELNKGAIEVESKLGVGSIFRFNLPKAK